MIYAMIKTTVVEVTILPWPPERGRKMIYVGGVAWGSIHMRGRGGSGNTYRFRQLEGALIQVPVGADRAGRERPFEVRGDKLERRYAEASHSNIDPRRHFPIVLPVADRLLAAARHLVTHKLLRDPADVREAEAREEIKAQERTARHKAEARAKLETKAREVVAPYADAISAEPLVYAIITAMEWAQVQ